MLITLDEVKEYLKVEYDDEDAMLLTLILAAQQLCEDVLREPPSPIQSSKSHFSMRWAIFLKTGHVLTSPS